MKRPLMDIKMNPAGDEQAGVAVTSSLDRVMG
jgi:hypothetical protein